MRRKKRGGRELEEIGGVFFIPFDKEKTGCFLNIVALHFMFAFFKRRKARDDVIFLY
jgi:hypothetical protein